MIYFEDIFRRRLLLNIVKRKINVVYSSLVAKLEPLLNIVLKALESNKNH